jgi:hypothetical protein
VKRGILKWPWLKLQGRRLPCYLQLHCQQQKFWEKRGRRLQLKESLLLLTGRLLGRRQK